MTDQPPSQIGHEPHRPRWTLWDWSWFVLKNVLGWAMILGAFAIGFLPGPGGLPLFVIGFGLITFPGKRAMTARVLRGIPVDPANRGYRWLVGSVAIAVPAALISYFMGRWLFLDPSLYPNRWRSPEPRAALLALAYASSVALLWIFLLRGVAVINLALRWVARGRRKARPWLRRKGLDLLPPRRRLRLRHGRHVREPDHEILEIHPDYHASVNRAWQVSKPWLKRVGGLAITVAIFYWMFKPVAQKWDQARGLIHLINWGHFAVGVTMFAVFLVLFRAMAWRRILDRMGHKLPVAATLRIFSTGELARYLPGWIWQVMGRVYLIRPYGVSAAECSTSQILELIIFLLANILVAVSCLLWLGGKLHEDARVLFRAAIVLAPVLLLILHPRVFYGGVNRVLRRFGKAEIVGTERLRRKRGMIGLGLWAVLGLLWQSLAIWVVVHEPLRLQFTKWWVVAGAYCLAWCAGFLAFWAPGGLGVRELVFVMAMQLALPPQVQRQFADPALRAALLAFLAILLRLWATGGELLLTAIAYGADYKGALGRADAPGRTSGTGPADGDLAATTAEVAKLPVPSQPARVG
jgi:uncharacterized membrane protein YbhN (UPF0104 family)